jgi:hypothetical protein
MDTIIHKYLKYKNKYIASKNKQIEMTAGALKKKSTFKNKTIIKDKVITQDLKEPKNINTHFVIIIDFNILSIAENIRDILKKLNFRVEIIYNKNNYNYINVPNNYMFIICVNINKKLEELPKNFIFFQIEQTNCLNFKSNDIFLQNATAVWDFSIKNYQKYKHIDFKKIFYLPLLFYSPSNSYISYQDINEYDILFYGTINDRRKNILSKLKNKYNIFTTETKNIFNEELNKYIKKSKIIINLHYYNDVALEICRINEVLKFNKLVISEKPSSTDYYNQLKYSKYVVYIDEIHNDLSNIDELYKTIDFYLKEDNYTKKINEIKLNLNDLCKKSVFHLYKNLLSIDIIKENKMEYTLTSDKIYCLHLIETPYRIDAFRNQENYPLIEPLLEIYPAIKKDVGWIGCALSYQNLMWNAKRCNLDRITICEDDCEIKNDFKDKYNIINKFLNEYTSGWDIFVGIIADLPNDTNILNVIEYEGITFVEIDKMTSTVFNIYNKSSFDKIINWKNKTNVILLDTIDRYINDNKFKIITTYPFEFDCLNIKSTLWNNNNFDIFDKMFKKTSELLKNKIDNYKNKNNFNIGVIITTCKHYFTNIPQLIIDLKANNFKDENILIVSGQEDNNHEYILNNIKIVKVTYTALHLTGLVYLYKNISSHNHIDYWIVLPDTIKIGSNFKNNITNFMINNDVYRENIYTIPFINENIRPTMDMGIMTNRHIINMGDYLNKILLTDYDKTKIIELKKQLIYDENIILGLKIYFLENATKFKYNDSNFSPELIKHYIVNSKNDIIEKEIILNGKLVNEVTFKTLDLIKYQRNYNGFKKEPVMEL